MKPLSRFQRDTILQYRFIDGLSFPDFSRRVKGVTAAAARQFVGRTRKRAGSDNLGDLLAASTPKPLPGRPPRVPVDPTASDRIRQCLRGPGQFQS